MSLSKEQIIKQALEQAKTQGIQIKSGATFDWTDSKNGLPNACNAIGACLLFFNLEKSENSIADLCSKLNTNFSWYYRFSIGFDVRNQILIEKKEGIYVKDSVSALGIELAKMYT